MGEEQEHIECERGNYTVIKILPEDLGTEITLNSLAQNADEEPPISNAAPESESMEYISSSLSTSRNAAFLPHDP